MDAASVKIRIAAAHVNCKLYQKIQRKPKERQQERAAKASTAFIAAPTLSRLATKKYTDVAYETTIRICAIEASLDPEAGRTFTSSAAAKACEWNIFATDDVRIECKEMNFKF